MTSLDPRQQTDWIEAVQGQEALKDKDFSHAYSYHYNNQTGF